MVKLFSVAGLTLLIAFPALAAVPPSPAISYQANNGALPTYTTATIFQGFETAPLYDSYPGQSGSGSSVMLGGWSDSVSGVYSSAVSPVNLGGQPPSNALHIAALSKYTMNFDVAQQFVSFYLYGFDAFTGVSLLLQDGTTLSYQGMASLGISPASSSTGRLNFDLTGQSGVKSFSLEDIAGSNSLYIDSIAAAAPEPTSWAMMIFGFGAVGFAMRRRRKKVFPAHG